MTWLATFYLGAAIFTGWWGFVKVVQMILSAVITFNSRITFKEKWELAVDTYPIFFFALFTALFFHEFLK